MGDDTPTKVCKIPRNTSRVFIVNRKHPNLFRTMLEYFSDRTDIDVILDRREGERQMRATMVRGNF